MMREEIDAIRKRYDDVASQYAELIDTRAERDRRFRESRLEPPPGIRPKA